MYYLAFELVCLVGGICVGVCVGFLCSYFARQIWNLTVKLKQKRYSKKLLNEALIARKIFR